MKRLFLAALFLPTLAWAQQPETIKDTKACERYVELLTIQRNQASDNVVMSEARARHMTEELLNAKNRVKDLEDELAKLKEKVK